MNSFKPKLFTQGSTNAVLVTGILSFLIHPFVFFGYKVPDLGFLAWFYLVPLLLGMHRYRFKHKFILAYTAGVLGHFGTFYWLMNAMQMFGGLNFFESFFTMILLCLLLGVFFALFISVASWLKLIVKIPLFVLLPVFMLARDFVLHHLPFGGFPWGIAAYSQGEWLNFFQWVDHTGAFGLSFFIYLINGLLAEGILLFIHRHQIDKMVTRFIVAFVLMLLSLYGSFLANQKFQETKTTLEPINVALIQANIPQDEKWLPFKAQDNLNKFLTLTGSAVKDGAQVVVWPETAYPYGIRFGKIGESQFLDREQLSAPILFGAVVADHTQSQRRIFNAVILADENGLMAKTYFKQHLVPFGEYLPMKEVFGFLSGLTQGVGEFDAGESSSLFEINGIKFGSLICFEDIFPALTIESARQGAEVLVNYTNDGWYGDTSAQHQHLVFSQFRALEARIPVLRSTNTGVTAVISSNGQVIRSLEPFTQDFLLHNLQIERTLSFFVVHGYSWVKMVSGLAFLIFLYGFVKVRLGPVAIRF